jgi:hypothetical protein
MKHNEITSLLQTGIRISIVISAHDVNFPNIYFTEIWS